MAQAQVLARNQVNRADSMVSSVFLIPHPFLPHLSLSLLSSCGGFPLQVYKESPLGRSALQATGPVLHLETTLQITKLGTGREGLTIPLNAPHPPTNKPYTTHLTSYCFPLKVTGKGCRNGGYLKADQCIHLRTGPSSLPLSQAWKPRQGA